MSTESTSPHHISVELNETHRRKKLSERSPVVCRDSLLP